MADGEFLNGAVRLMAGDCRKRVRELRPASLDAVVTDPPYALVSIVKRFGSATAKGPKGDVYARAASGFMGQQWDTGEVAFDPGFWADVRRAMKPGAHLVAFSGTRSYHRLVCAIEDAGFEIRDQLAWVYGVGFPKSHDVSKAIDRTLGAARDVTGFYERPTAAQTWAHNVKGGPEPMAKPRMDDPATPEAEEWDGWGTGLKPGFEPAVLANEGTAEGMPIEPKAWKGWGTALKPGWEPIVLARVPLDGTVAQNVLKWGTGGINVDLCRIGGPLDLQGGGVKPRLRADDLAGEAEGGELGRWPANILHDGSEEVVDAFPSDAGGSSARFFYSAKADAQDRIGSKHPTVKPVDLMQWLCRLICPPRGVILDPFAGSGTTGEAAWREGFKSILMEREETFQADIARRMTLAVEGPATRKREIAKVKGQSELALAGGLFEDIDGGGE